MAIKTIQWGWNNVVTQVIAFEGEGVLQEYMGGYEDWVRARNLLKESAEKVTRPRKKGSVVRAPKPISQPKLSKHEIDELEVLLGKIELLEQEQASITCKLSDSETYHDSPDKIVKLQIRLASIEKEIMNYLARWDELETKKLKIESNSYN
jgi:ATP-binding cassette subfamily F protein uup